MNWEQVLANIVPVITIVGGMIAWLRNDINRTLGQHAKRILDHFLLVVVEHHRHVVGQLVGAPLRAGIQH